MAVSESTTAVNPLVEGLTTVHLQSLAFLAFVVVVMTINGATVKLAVTGKVTVALVDCTLDNVMVPVPPAAI